MLEGEYVCRLVKISAAQSEQTIQDARNSHGCPTPSGADHTPGLLEDRPLLWALAKLFSRLTVPGRVRLSWPEPRPGRPSSLLSPPPILILLTPTCRNSQALSVNALRPKSYPDGPFDGFS